MDFSIEMELARAREALREAADLLEAAASRTTGRRGEVLQESVAAVDKFCEKLDVDCGDTSEPEGPKFA